jgi:hypothetical protein
VKNKEYSKNLAQIRLSINMELTTGNIERLKSPILVLVTLQEMYN